MNYKRSAFRRSAGSRGFRTPNMVPGGNFPQFGVPIPQFRTIYDYTLDKGNLEGTKNTSDAVFEKEILDRAANLTPSVEIRKRINEYAKKVIVALEKEKREKTLVDIGIATISHVGSFVTDTTTHSSDKSDVVVQLSTLPSYETVAELGRKVVENMKIADPKETGEPLQMEYGCLITSHNCQVRLLITIIPEESTKLEPLLHLDSKQMMINFFSTRHITWFSQISSELPPAFIQEWQALVRVLKDTRSRYSDFQPLSIWTIQYLAFYCLANGPNRQKACLGTAFRRFFEIIAAGIFLPKSPCLIDPVSANYRIGFDLTLPQMDTVCMGAQTLVRIFATGNDGYRAILGTHGTAADLTQTISTWKGIEIRPSIDAYRDGCMTRFPARAEIPTV
ncbi:DZF domain-containing protein [Caenorhabditis elegans]|uniref:DZF domain-containing protein n=1 Tax=Caenorhabditis elegans TaxID=6239 RepID=O62349_CAEEL|nr:DZF domain-containing protein [Caenorhabditis elegans]CAB07644.2 DZF domain-containing protein [Caenorhabditis elegans]|eukprot:NP_506614.2 Uncharacterized protein CELE_R11H6.5 [Caenorhabditis elegans]